MASSSSSSSSMDRLIVSLKETGAFQLIASFCLWSNTFPLAFNNYNMVFYGIPPSHHCMLPDNITDNPLNHSLPMSIKDPTKIDSCSMYDVPGNFSSGNTTCQNGYEYVGNPVKWSVASEWDLVCDRQWLVSLATSIYFVGVMFGGLFGGMLGDMYGRRPVMLVSMYVQVILGLSTAFVNSFPLFVVVRFAHAFMLQTSQLTSFTILMEMYRPRMRTFAGATNSLAWTLSSILLAFTAYGLNNWWHVQLVLSAPGLITITYYWFVPESVRWLVSTQKIEQAEEVVTKIAKFNKIDRKQVDLHQLLKECSNECKNPADTEKSIKRYGFLDLFRTKSIRIITLINCFLWFTASIVVYGVAYALPSLGGSIYMGFAISGGIELIVRIFMFPILDRCGRKGPLIVSLVCATISLGAIPFILHYGTGVVAEYMSMGAAVSGKALMTATFTIISIYTPELYPTVVRSVGQGTAYFCTRIGGIVAPQLRIAGMMWKPAPFVICSGFALIAAVLTLFLEDTHNKKMPDMIEEAEKQPLSKDVKNPSSKQETKANGAPNGNGGVENLGYEHDETEKTRAKKEAVLKSEDPKFKERRKENGDVPSVGTIEDLSSTKADELTVTSSSENNAKGEEVKEIGEPGTSSANVKDVAAEDTKVVDTNVDVTSNTAEMSKL